MATSSEEDIFPSEDSFGENWLFESKDVSTQCNFYLSEKPHVKHKAVTCNLIKCVGEGREKSKVHAKPLKMVNAVTQCFLEPYKASSENSAEKPLGKNIHTQTSAQTLTKYTPPTLSLFDEITQILEKFDELVYEVLEDYSGAPVMRISRRKTSGCLSEHRGFCEVPVTFFVQVNGNCNLSILFKSPKPISILKENGDLDVNSLTTTLNVISCRMGHIFCPGINPASVADDSFTKPKHLKYIEFPFPRYQSADCLVFYQQLPQEVTEISRVRKRQCPSCVNIAQGIAKAKKRKSLESPDRKFKRQRVSSNFPIKNLTPKSKKIRISRIQQARSVLTQKVVKLEKQLKLREISLNENQSEELSNIVQIISNNYSSELETSINTTSGNTREMLKMAWDRDSKQKHLSDQKDFFSEQEQLTRNSRVRKWNATTLRMCLAVCSRSKAAYEALRGFKLLNLPSVSTLREKTRKLNHSPGINEEYLYEQQCKYKKFQAEKERKGDLIPMGIGVTIFDEVKVIDKVIWNSKSHEFMGLAMSEDDYPELTDIYKDKTVKAPAPTQYVLQYIWRDLTSGFDLIGPHFTSPYPFQQKSLVTTLYQTLEALEMFNFKSLGLVCDGASENLSLIKLTMGETGALGFKIKDGIYDFSVQPRFENPFSETPKFLHWIICPSHEMKNMVGQLHASREDGPKAFQRNGVPFGWKEVVDVYARDEQRVKNNQLRVARFLIESYIIRDSWTRLNVAPSKVLQQEDVLSELFGFAHGEEGTAEQRESALEAYRYLRACNKIFENGFLRAKAVKDISSDVLQSVQEGYLFFEDWLRELLEANPDININSPRQKHFLSWQTWDLLRVMVFGIKGLAEDFFKYCPGYFLSLIRINGSAVESFFAQIKYATGSKLSGTNFVSAKKAIMIRANVHGNHRGNKDYRDQMLCFRESDL